MAAGEIKDEEGSTFDGQHVHNASVVEKGGPSSTVTSNVQGSFFHLSSLASRALDYTVQCTCSSPCPLSSVFLHHQPSHPLLLVSFLTKFLARSTGSLNCNFLSLSLSLSLSVLLTSPIEQQDESTSSSS